MKRYVLITGASGGLGKSFAELFAMKGHNLFLAARSEEKLQKLSLALSAKYHVDVKYMSIDLSDPDSPQKIYDETHRQKIFIEQLVNNAGSGNMALVGDADPSVMVQTINLNITSITLLCNLYIPDMKKVGHGKILNVSSLGAFQPDPYFAVYGATKAYELLFSESLYGELLGTGVTVSVLCPGPIKTNWASNAGKADSKIAKSPELIARLGYEGMQKGKLIIIPTMGYKAEAFIVRVAPKTLVANVIRKWQGGLIQKAR